MKFAISAALAAAALGTFTSGASAATVKSFSFDFSCGDGVPCDIPTYETLGSSFTATVDGLSVAVGAGSFASVTSELGIITEVAFKDDVRLGRYPGGLGVSSDAQDSLHIDGSGEQDFVRLAFDRGVELTGLGFEFFGGGQGVEEGQFQILLDVNEDGLLGIGDFISTPFLAGSSVELRTIEGTIWGIAAVRDAEEFKLTGVSVEAVSGEVPAVPLPAAGFLLLAGMGGLGLMSRRSSVRSRSV